MATAKKKVQVKHSAVVAKAIADAPPSADSAGLLRDIIREWGGTAELARDIRTEFREGGAGGQTRQRILEMIQRLIVTNTQHDIGKAVEPSSMSDEDLNGVASRLLKKVSDAIAADGTDAESPGA